LHLTRNRKADRWTYGWQLGKSRITILLGWQFVENDAKLDKDNI